MLEPTQTFLLVQVDGNHLIQMLFKLVFIYDCRLEYDVWRLLPVGPLAELCHNTRVDQFVEATQHLFVAEDYLCNPQLVNAAVAAENGGTEEGVYLVEERRVVIVFSSLTVGNEAGDADLFERLEHCRLATADASCQSNVFHFIIIYWI